jgi:hypothetical protein
LFYLQILGLIYDSPIGSLFGSYFQGLAAAGHNANAGWLALECVVPNGNTPFGRIAWAGGLIVFAFCFVSVLGLLFCKRLGMTRHCAVQRCLFVFNYMLSVCYVSACSYMFRYLLNCEHYDLNEGITISFLTLDASYPCPSLGVRWTLGLFLLVSLFVIVFCYVL